jgi:hypothetical protein
MSTAQGQPASTPSGKQPSATVQVKCEPTEDVSAAGTIICQACKQNSSECTYELVQIKRQRRTIKAQSALPEDPSALSMFLSDTLALPQQPMPLSVWPDITPTLPFTPQAMPPLLPRATLPDMTAPTIPPAAPLHSSLQGHWRTRPASIRLPDPGIANLSILAPLPLLKDILGLFFTHLHPLTPLVHQPSFMAAFDRGEYAVSPSFFAQVEPPIFSVGADHRNSLVTSLIAATLLQIPHVYLGIESRQKVSMMVRFTLRAGF